MKKIFAEVGFGNESFLSTEIEQGKKEYRISKFLIPREINGFYLRIIIFGTVLILSTYDGLKIKKNRKKFKFLFGIEGIGLK